MTNIESLKTNIQFINNTLEDLEKDIQQYQKDIEKLTNENINLKKELNNLTTLENKNIKSLNIFTNISHFNKYVEELYNVQKWNIKSSSYKDRAETLKNYSYWNILKEQFTSKKLTHWNISNEQMVSFFDTMHLMYIMLNSFNNDDIKNNMIIIQEYQIETLNKPRIDYLLAYRNNIVLLEFGKSNNYLSLAKDTSKKQQQLNGYETSIKSTLVDSDTISVMSIPIIYLSEDDEQNIESNNNTISDAVKKINKMLLKNKNAFEQLQLAE